MATAPTHSRLFGIVFKTVAALASVGAALVSILTFAKSEGIYRGSILPASDAGWVKLEPAADTATAIGDTIHFAAAVTDTRGVLLQGADISWTTGDSGIARVRSDGRVIATGGGETAVIATVGGAIGRARVVVRQVVAALQLPRADGLTLAQGSDLPLTARALDRRGHAVLDRRVTWHTADTTVLVIDSLGRALGVAPGSSQISALVDGLTANATVTVTPVLGSLVRFAPATDHALPGATLPDAVAIRALSRQSRPMAGVLVRLHAVDGAGIATGMVAPDTARSDAEGVVRVHWTVGATPGRQYLVADAEPLDTPLRIPIEVEPVPANTRLTAIDDPATASVATTLPHPIGIRVTDSAGRPLPDIPVRWVALAGTASAQGARTDSAGEAHANWTLGRKAGTERLRVSVGSGRLVPPINLVATATAGTPTRVLLAAGAGQRGTAGSVLPHAVAALVTDAEGNPVTGVAVRMLAGAGRAADSVVTTDATGIARTRWTLGGQAGTLEFRFEVANGAAPLTATMHAIALPGPATAFTFVDPPKSPTSQTSVRVTARVTDAYGNGVPHAIVHLSVSLGRVTPKTVTSDTAGRITATWTLTASSAEQVLTLQTGQARGTLTMKRAGMAGRKKRK